jgi:hypothetical protein
MKGIATLFPLPMLETLRLVGCYGFGWAFAI